MARDDDLPRELWREILSRVPVKSILRCRSVCKSWYSLISCPYFISDYSTRNLNKNDNCVLLRVFDESDRSWSYSSHNVSFSESREHDDDIPKQFLGRDVEIVGSCNGLICLSKFDQSRARDETVITFLIWNPTIRKVVELPSRTFRPCTQCAPCFGFGFDSNTNDYKVLMSFDEYRKNGDLSVVENICEIFCLREGDWRVISSKRPVEVSFNMDRLNPWSPTYQECYLNGAVHWSGFISSNGFTMFLLSFDMSDECFRAIRLPDCLDFNFNDDDDYDYLKTQSMTIGGLIYVIANTVEYDDHQTNVSWSCSLWMMKEYGITESWTKVSNIDMQSFLDNSTDDRWPIGFHLWENGEVLVECDVIGPKLLLVLYNIESREFKCIFSTTKHCRYLCRLEESLVLM